MGTRFHGWPEQASGVLLQLGGEPTREIRERVRRGREVYRACERLRPLLEWLSQHTVAVLASDLEDGQHAPTALDIGVREL